MSLEEAALLVDALSLCPDVDCSPLPPPEVLVSESDPVSEESDELEALLEAPEPPEVLTPLLEEPDAPLEVEPWLLVPVLAALDVVIGALLVGVVELVALEVGAELVLVAEEMASGAGPLSVA